MDTKQPCLRAENEQLRAGYSAARLEIESLKAQLASIGAGGVEPLRKRECLHQITEPDHFRGATKMIAEAEHFEREWYLDGDALEAALSTILTPPGQAQDADRYRWLRDHRGWQVLHRIRPGKSIEYRMRDDGDWWGHWWPTHEQAIDAARAAQKVK